MRLRRSEEESWTQRTEIRRKTLNPVWNAEFTVEVMDDRVLQDAPVEFRVMDQDLYSSEAIGSVFVDLNPLITRTAYGVTDVKDRLAIKGWFPIFDTSQGINRGFLKLTVKLQFIGNDNPLNSAGVQFFSSSSLAPHCFIIQECIGFVVDLVVEDDPEESWQDYFRNAIKASNLNDSRLKVLYNLSAMVRREVGKKVIEAGGNAVLGYHAQFDMEGSSGLVARAYGTSCRLLKVSNSSVLSVQSEGLQRLRHKHLPVLGPNQPLAIFPTDSFSPFVPYSIRSEGGALGSDPVALLQMSLDGSLSVHQLRGFGSAERPTLLHEKSLFQSEVQLLSLTEFGPHVDVRLGRFVILKK